MCHAQKVITHQTGAGAERVVQLKILGSKEPVQPKKGFCCVPVAWLGSCGRETAWKILSNNPDDGEVWALLRGHWGEMAASSSFYLDPCFGKFTFPKPNILVLFLVLVLDKLK